jgi:hypothetical protein
MRLNTRLHMQVGAPPHMGVQVATRSAPALAVLLRHLVDAQAFLFDPVEVVVDRETRFASGVQIDLMDRILGLQVRYMQGTSIAMKSVPDAAVVFAALEVRQKFVVRPTLIAQSRPMVVIAGVPTGVNHGIDGRGAAQAFAAWLVAPAAIQSHLRHSFKSVVVDAGRQHGHRCRRRVDQPAVALATRLQQHHLHISVFAQAAGHHAAARAAANHDVVWFMVQAVVSY